MKFTVSRGTFDILPEDAPMWQFIERTSREVFRSFNYQEIRTPVFEATELFARSIGSTTDIVTKEMYTFLDKKGRSLTLRPEETASVVRACLENNLISADKGTKLYYIGPMFRYERPQAGRYRQFHQVGVEAFGSSDPLLDVEIILLGVEIFKKLGLKDLSVDINSVGCPDCRPAYLEALKKYFAPKIKDMCEDCRKRLEFNPLRILDCKNPICQKAIAGAPAPLDFICAKCKGSFEKTIGYLKASGANFNINNRLVRGLDYYTNMTFEVISKQLGAQNAVCGGGRYDNLVEDLGGKSTPAVGFAIGVERTIEVLKSFSIKYEGKKLDVFVAAMGEAASLAGFNILQDLRKSGLAGDMDYFDRSLKAKMKAADRTDARYTLIIGDEELKKKTVLLKNMGDGSQKEVAVDKIVFEIRP